MAAKNPGIPVILVKDVRSGSGAAEGGMKKGDVIISVNEHPVSNSSELQEQIGLFRPGDAVKVKVLRGKDIDKIAAACNRYPVMNLKCQLGERNDEEIELRVNLDRDEVL